MTEQESVEQPETNRRHYETSLAGSLTSYAAHLGQGFEYRINLPAQILQGKHYATLGKYKERLLVKLIAQFIPQRYEVGTGFVIFPKAKPFESKSHSSSPSISSLPSFSAHEVSKQCDIIVYDAHAFPVAYKDENFVIVLPESVRSVIEVKGTLRRKSIEKAIRGFIDLGTKWRDCSQFYNEIRRSPPEVPHLFLMGWQVYIPRGGNPETDGKRLREQIVSTYRNELTERGLGELLVELGSEGFIEHFPTLNAAYIYNDCRIVVFLEAGEGWTDQWGLGTLQGRFAWQDEPKEKTIASLLESILGSLEAPRSPFSFLGSVNNAEPSDSHPCNGFTPWVEPPVDWR